MKEKLSSELGGQVGNVLEKFLNEEQDPAIAQEAYSKVSQILTSEEEITYIAVQKKPVVNITPQCVVLTNKRFIIYKPKVLGRVDFEDHIWRDLRGVHLKEGLMGAMITVQTVKGRRLSVYYLPKAQARRLYSLAQAKEEEMREVRRIRDLEERKASAGGIVLQDGRPVREDANQQQSSDPVQKLKQLKEMKESDLITESEYEAKKGEILSRM